MLCGLFFVAAICNAFSLTTFHGSPSSGKLLFQRLDSEALNWDAIELLWKSEDRIDAEDAAQHDGPRSLLNHASRRSAYFRKGPKEQERWSSQDLVHISGWTNPKKITFVLAAQAGHGLHDASEAQRGLDSLSLSFSLSPLLPRKEVGGRVKVLDPSAWQAVGESVLREDKMENDGEWVDEDISPGEEDDSASLDGSPSPWDNLDEDNSVPGVTHDRGFTDAGKFDSPVVVDVRKSPIYSPMTQPSAIDKAVLGLEPGAIDELHASAENAAGFDGQDVSSMSTDDDYCDDSGWRAMTVRAPDFRADLGVTLLGLGLPDSRNVLTEIGLPPPSNLALASSSLALL